MSRGAERDSLRWLGDVGLLRVVGGDESRYVDQHVRCSEFSSARIDRHSAHFRTAGLQLSDLRAINTDTWTGSATVVKATTTSPPHCTAETDLVQQSYDSNARR